MAVKYCEKCNARIDDAPYCMCEEERGHFGIIIALALIVVVAIILAILYKTI